MMVAKRARARRSPPSRDWRSFGLALLATAAGPVCAQSLTVTPTFNLVETLTDNRDTRASSKQGDLITQISPGLSVQSRRGALQGSLSYALNGVLYARESSLNSVFHSLNAAGQLSLFDGRAGLRASASAGRNQISAFGTTSATPSTATDNQAQTVSYSLSPYVSGQMPGQVRYSAALTASGSRSDAASSQGDATQLGFNAGLSGALGRLGWNLTFNRQQSDQAGSSSSANGSTNRTGQLTAGLSFAPDVDWNVNIRAGRELNNIRTGSNQQSTTWGYGATWLPGPRTTLRFDSDRRFFGRSHSLQFSHRMARTVLTLSDTRNLNTSGVAGRAEVSLYDMLYALSREPDPVKRDLEVRSLLQQQGLDPNQTVVVGGFLTSAATVERRQQASVTYQGLRFTVNLSAFVGNTSRASSSSTADDDLSAGDVRQSGFTSTLSYRLTPSDNLAVSIQQQRTAGSGGREGNDLTSLLATWSSTLGRYTSGSLALRHSVSGGQANAYTENALIGSLQIRF